MKLTQTKLTGFALGEGETDKIIFDDDMPGFGLRLRAGGSRKFVVHYRQGGLQRRLTIGPASALTLEEARHRARKVLVAVADGRNPASEKAEQRAAAGLLFGPVAADYLRAVEPNMRHKSFILVKYYLEQLWKPLRRVPLANITRAVIATRIRSIATENGAVSANRARGALSAMFAWAMGEGLCDANPVIGTNKAIDEKPRDRVLSDAELAAIWGAAPDNDYGRIVRLLILTGCRREEIGDLRRGEVDLEKKLITLPAARTKNGREHLVPLSDDAFDLLRPGIRRGDYVFGDEGGFTSWGYQKRALDQTCGVTNWTLHDLRRTAATMMADIGVQPHIIEAALNHVSGHKAGVAGIYNRSTYATEKRAALDLWGNHIRVIVAQSEGANVTALNRRSKPIPPSFWSDDPIGEPWVR
jgi:integrase